MIVLDTNVVSEAMRSAPDPRVTAWLDAQDAGTLYLTTVTLAELLFGIGVLAPGRRKSVLVEALEGLLALFEGRVLPFDASAARCYADRAVAARAAGRAFPTPDGYIAATAAALGFAVATREVAPFRAAGVETIDPWSEAR